MEENLQRTGRRASGCEEICRDRVEGSLDGRKSSENG